MIYKIDDWSFDSEQGILSSDKRVEKPRLKVVQVLTMLLQNRNRIVTRVELIEQFWAGNMNTGQKSLTSVIYAIRNLLKRNTNTQVDNPQVIQTVPKRGYRITATVEEVMPKFGWHIFNRTALCNNFVRSLINKFRFFQVGVLGRNLRRLQQHNIDF